MGKYKIALVWPKGFDPIYVMPLPLGYLKSNLDETRYEVKVIDCSLNNLQSDSPQLKKTLTEYQPDLVGVSTWSPMNVEAINILKLAKIIDPKIHTVIGGAHASSYPHRVMENQEVDFLFQGEAELSFPVFLEELQKENSDWSAVKGLFYRSEDGSFAKNEPDLVDDLDTIKFPDYNLMDLDGYIKAGYRWNSPYSETAPIWATRGCPYRCTYCAAPELNGKPVREHGIDYLIDWITYLHDEKGIRWFNIIDDNFTFNVKFAKAFCRRVIDLDLKGVGFGTPNGIRLQRGDPELWQLMKKAGWNTLIVAPESGSAHTLEIMKKDLDPEIVPGVVKDIRSAGLKVQGFFILGYPGELLEDIDLTAKMIKDCDFDFVFMNNFQPLPGTPVYDELVAKGEIEDGLMPQNYSDGVRVYTPPELKNFNFPRFVLKQYLFIALRNPFKIPYMISLFTPKLLVRKLLLNIKAVFIKKETRSATFGSLKLKSS